jgi:flagellar motility protein MotE (MotC chaperone)
LKSCNLFPRDAKALDKREQQLGAREALLKAAEQEVDKKVAELNTLKADIEKLLGQQQTMEETRIVSLVKIYEGMKPKEAATIFNTLDMDVLLAVISRMSERKSSPVLAAMDPNKARIVTIKLAEQRKLPSAPAQKPAPAAPAPQSAPAEEGAETPSPTTTP